MTMIMHDFQGLHEDTEKFGDVLSADEINVIIHRLSFLKAYIRCNDTLLDVGSGDGLVPSLISSDVKDYIAVELVEANVSKLSLNKSIHPVRADAVSLPIADNCINSVIAMAMIYYIDFDLFLSEVARVLAPDGQLLFCTSNPEIPTFCKARNTIRYYDISELNSKLINYGFEPIFFGAFPIISNLSIIYKSFSVIRNFLKGIIYRGFFKIIWDSLRVSYYGGQSKIDVNEIDNYLANCKFDPSSVLINKEYNKINRVIYCKATIRK